MVLLILECLHVIFRTIFGHFWAGQSKPPRLMQCDNFTILRSRSIKHCLVSPKATAYFVSVILLQNCKYPGCGGYWLGRPGPGTGTTVHVLLTMHQKREFQILRINPYNWIIILYFNRSKQTEAKLLHSQLFKHFLVCLSKS